MLNWWASHLRPTIHGNLHMCENPSPIHHCLRYNSFCRDGTSCIIIQHARSVDLKKLLAVRCIVEESIRSESMTRAFPRPLFLPALSLHMFCGVINHSMSVITSCFWGMGPPCGSSAMSAPKKVLGHRRNATKPPEIESLVHLE